MWYDTSKTLREEIPGWYRPRVEAEAPPERESRPCSRYYAAASMATFSLARYRRTGYATFFAVVENLGHILALLIWNAALWSSEPAPPVGHAVSRGVENVAQTRADRMGRFITEA